MGLHLNVSLGFLSIHGSKELLHGFGHLHSSLKIKSTFFKFVVCNPSKSSPSLTILVFVWFIIIED